MCEYVWESLPKDTEPPTLQYEMIHNVPIVAYHAILEICNTWWGGGVVKMRGTGLYPYTIPI